MYCSLPYFRTVLKYFYFTGLFSFYGTFTFAPLQFTGKVAYPMIFLWFYLHVTLQMLNTKYNHNIINLSRGMQSTQIHYSK